MKAPLLYSTCVFLSLAASAFIVSPVLQAREQVTSFQPFTSTPEFSIEVDVKSLELLPRLGGWDVEATVRRVLAQEVRVPGKKKPGAFYLDELVAQCDAKSVTLVRSRLFSKDGEVLSERTEPQTFSDPEIEGHFVTDFLSIMCKSAAKIKPPMLTRSDRVCPDIRCGSDASLPHQVLKMSS